MRGCGWALAIMGVISSACFSEPAPPGGAGSTGDATTGDGGPGSTSRASDPTSEGTGTGSDTGTEAEAEAEADTTAGPPPSGPARQRIELDTSAVTEPLQSVPVLLRLPPDMVDYDSIAPDGSDVRMFAADGSTPLPFELEAWNAATGTTMWLRLGDVEPGVTTEVFLAYGDPSAPQPPPPTEVWSDGYEAVWHLPRLEDSTGNGHTLLVQGGEDPPMEAIGPFGPAASFARGTAALGALDDDGRLTLVSAGTVEAWVSPMTDSMALEGVHRSAVDKWPNYRLATISGANGRPVYLATVGTTMISAQTAMPLEVGTWRRLAGTVQVASNMVEWCLRATGQAQACDAEPGLSTDPTPAPLSVGTATLAADLDEVRISTVRRSSQWLELQERAVAPDFATFHPPEPWP